MVYHLLSGLPNQPGEAGMAIHITDHTMTLKTGDRVVATARFSEHAAANGNGAWIVSTHPARLFTRDQAITALTVTELGESGNTGGNNGNLLLEIGGCGVPSSRPSLRACGDWWLHSGPGAKVVACKVVSSRRGKYSGASRSWRRCAAWWPRTAVPGHCC